MVASRWGLSFAAAFSVAATLLMSAGVAAHLDLSPSIWGAELAPYLALIISLENVLCITKSVVYTSPSLDVSERLSQGLANEGFALTKFFLIECAVTGLGYLSRVSEVIDFCRFAFIGLVVDFYMQVSGTLEDVSSSSTCPVSPSTFCVSARSRRSDSRECSSSPPTSRSTRTIPPSRESSQEEEGADARCVGSGRVSSRVPREDPALAPSPRSTRSQKWPVPEVKERETHRSGHRRTLSAVKIGEQNASTDGAERSRRPQPRVSTRLRLLLLLTKARLAHRTLICLFCLFILWIGVIANLWKYVASSPPSLHLPG